MSYGISVGNTGATPVLTPQGTDGRSLPWRSRSRYIAPVATPPISGSATITVSFSVALARGAIFTTYDGPDGTTGTITINEKKKSRSLKDSGDGKEYTRTFQVIGTQNPQAAAALGPQIGDKDDEYPTFFVTSRSLKEDAWGDDGNAAVEIVVTYNRPGPDNPQGGDNQGTFGYEFGSESEHVDVALAQTHQGGTNADAARIGFLINVSDEEVQGVDINSPIIEVTEEHQFSEAEFSPAVRRAMRDHMQKTNKAAFREWDAGEVLFIGASARKQGKIWNITYQFRVRRNYTGPNAIHLDVYLTDGGAATPLTIEKSGWQYLWIESRRTLIQARGQAMRTAPYAAHVATVYGEVDFAVLGIGTDPLP